MVDTESPGFAPVHSARFATIPSDRRVSAETEAKLTQTLVVLELQYNNLGTTMDNVVYYIIHGTTQ